MKVLRLTMLGLVSSALVVMNIAPAAHAVSPTPPPVPDNYVSVHPMSVSDAPHGINDQRGIIKLHNCSASLVRFRNSQPNDRGLMLTNGHCLPGGMPKMGEVRMDQSVKMPASILNDNSKEVMSVQGQKLLYGTMTDTDAALIELDYTFKQIKDKTGIDAYLMADHGPKVGDALTVNSGYWKEYYRCPMIKQIYELREGEWTTKDSIKFKDNCGTKHGTSGSPVLDDKTGEVVGINNTGNDDGGRCTDNNPCEVDEQGNIFYKKGTNYGQQTFWFYSCWSNDRKIDMTMPYCRLPQKDTGKPKPFPTQPPTTKPTPTKPSATPTKKDDGLSNGVAVKVSAKDGKKPEFKVNLSKSVKNFSIKISGGTGEGDLYVRKDAKPDLDHYDCRPFLYGNDETCNFDGQAKGVYNIMLNPDPEFSNIELVAAWDN